MVDRGVGDGDVDTVDVQDGARLDQLVQKRHLVGGQLLGEKIGDRVEIGPVGEEKGRGLEIPHRGRVEEQAAGILVEPQHHHGRFFRRRLDAALPEEVTEDGHRRPDRLDAFDGAGDVGLPGGVVVVDMQFDPRPAGDLAERADAIRLANVDEDQAGDGIEVDVADALEIVSVEGALDEEIAQIALLGTGEDHRRLRVEAAGGDHRPEAVEIGVDVGGDDVHKEGPGSRGSGFSL